MSKAVFLDRDGVINEVLTKRVRFVNSPDDLFLLPRVALAIRRLKEAGYKVFVVTNQGGIGKGYMSEEDLQHIHSKLADLLSEEGASIDEIAYCPHDPAKPCSCRKPQPGMILQLAEHHHVHLSDSIMIGDRNDDIECGLRAGIPTNILIGTDSTKATHTCSSLYDAVNWILA